MTINKIKEKIQGKYLFLFSIFALYFVLFFINKTLFWQVFKYFLKLMKEVSWIFLFIVFLMFLSNLFLGGKKILHFFQNAKGVKMWIFAIVGGILSSGPIYMWYPILLDLREKGLKDSLIVVFLYNRAIKIPLIPMMLYYFSLKFIIVLTIYMIIFSIINGFVMEKILKEYENSNSIN